MKRVIGKHCCSPFRPGRLALVISYIKRAKTWFSEKRSQIPILGLDSLLLQAYNPPPLPGIGKRFKLQGSLLEGLEDKATKKNF